jgi:group I intron endonuclease
MISGIYCIENTVNNKKYIGKSVNIEKRFNQHKRELNKNNHKNRHLQYAWNKYGEKNFKFQIVEKCEKDNKKLTEREIYFISYYNAKNKTYNETDGGEGLLGRKHTLQTINKISLFAKNRPPEINKKISDSMKGHIITKQTRDKISNSKKGKHLSEIHKKKIKDGSLHVCGENISFSKLKEKDVLKILDLRFNKNFKIKDISNLYLGKCSLRTIKSIVYGENWRKTYNKFIQSREGA